MYYFHSAFRLDMHLRIYRKFVNVANCKHYQRIGFGKFFPDVPYMQLSVICIQVSGYPAPRKIIISCDILLFQVLKCLAFGKYIFKPVRYISDRNAFDKIKIRYFPYFFKQFAFRLKREIHHHIILVQNGHCFYRTIKIIDYKRS